MENIQATLERDFLEDFAQHISPEIYLKNSFRILQISPQSSTKEIQKRHQIIDISERTGAEIPLGPLPILAIKDPTPDPMQIDEAIQRINDPQTRLLEELFWYWPDGKNGNSSFQDSDTQAITHLLDQLAEDVENGPSDPAALHNLAVLYHAIAIDIELTGINGGLKEQDSSRLQSLWTLSYKYWDQLFQEDEFWDELTRRIRQYEDPRLTTGTSRRLRSQLPRYLARMHSQLVIRYFEKSKYEDAARNLQLLRSSTLPQDLLEDSLKWVTDPIRQRIKSFTAQTKEFSDAELPHANKTIANLIDQGQTQLGIIDRCLSEKDVSRIDAHDEFALAVLASIKDYFHRTEQCEEASKLLYKIEGLAYSPSAKEEIKKTNQSVSEFRDQGDYWYGPKYYDQPADVLQTLERARKLISQGQIDRAIQEIEGKLTGRVVAQDLYETCKYPLSSCYNQKAVRLLNSISEIVGQPRSIVEQIIQRVQNKDFSVMMAIQAMEIGRLNSFGQMGYLNCMACGTPIHGQYFTFKFKDLPMLVCPGCHSLDQNEHSRKLQSIKEKLSQAVRDLIYSQELNPGNRLAADNLKGAREMASGFEISVPTTSGRQKPKVGREQPEIQQPLPQSRPVTPVTMTPNREVEVKEEVGESRSGNKGLYWVLAILFVMGALLFFAASQSGQSSSSPPVNVPPSSSVIVTQRPTTVAVIIPTNTRYPTITPLPTAVILRGCFTTTTNVRTGPGTNYQALGYFQAGDCNPVVGISPDRGWYQMEAKSPSGSIERIWVYAKNVEMDSGYGSVSDLPVIR